MGASGAKGGRAAAGAKGAAGAKALTPAQVEAKRERERRVVGEMIAVFCHGQHGTRGSELCPECARLAEYASVRIGRCPFMATKSFCSQCRVHCYAPEERARIKDVMRYAGPRMLLRHPVMTVRHGIDTLAARRRQKREA